MNVNKRAQLNRCLSVIAWKNTSFFSLLSHFTLRLFTTSWPLFSRLVPFCCGLVLCRFHETKCWLLLSEVGWLVSLQCLGVWRWLKRNDKREVHKFNIPSWLWFGLTADMQIILTLLWHLLTDDGDYIWLLFFCLFFWNFLGVIEIFLLNIFGSSFICEQSAGSVSFSYPK